MINIWAISIWAWQNSSRRAAATRRLTALIQQLRDDTAG